MFIEEKLERHRANRLKLIVYISYLIALSVFLSSQIELIVSALGIFALVFNVTGVGYMTCAISNSKYAHLSTHTPYVNGQDSRIGEFIYGAICFIASSLYFLKINLS